MIFGTAFLGKVEDVKGHWIETKFVIIGVPVFPISSMLVTDSTFRSRKGFNIALNEKSIIAGYLRIFLAVLAVVFFVCAEHNGLFALAGIALAMLWLYFCIGFGRANKRDADLREKFGHTTGLYLLPQWLDGSDLYTIYEQLDTKYNFLFGQNDWLVDLQTMTEPDERSPFLYALAYVSYVLGLSEENREMFEKADYFYTNSEYYKDKTKPII